MGYAGATTTPSFQQNGKTFVMVPGTTDSEAPEDHECSACFNFMTKPVKACKRNKQHRFCLTCIEDLATCPLCRELLHRDISKFDVDTKFIKSVKFFCPNYDEGCKETLSLANSETGAHLNQCQEEMVECPNQCTQGSVNAGSGNSVTALSSVKSFSEIEQPSTSENNSTNKKTCIDTPTGEHPHKIKRKDIPKHLESCAQFFICECDEKFPNIKNPEYFNKYLTHTREHPENHRLLA